jgi:hypothetical protein
MACETSSHTSLENMSLNTLRPHPGHAGYSWCYVTLFSQPMDLALFTRVNV